MSKSLALRGLLTAFLLIGLYLLYAGYQLRYYGRTGPGPGFFPIWIGGILAVSSLWALVKDFIRTRDLDLFLESREAAYRVAIVLAGLFGTWVLLEYLGYRIAIFLFAMIIPPLLGPQKLIVTFAVAVIFSFGTAYVFEHWLQVWLPEPSISFLADLGF